MPSVAQSVANGTAGLDLREALLGAGCGEVESHPRPLAVTAIADLHPVVRIEGVAQAATTPVGDRGRHAPEV